MAAGHGRLTIHGDFCFRNNIRRFVRQADTVVARETFLSQLKLGVGRETPVRFGDFPTVVRRKRPRLTNLQWDVFFTWVKFILDCNCFPQVNEIFFDFELGSGKPLIIRREMARNVFKKYFHLSYYCNTHVKLVCHWTDVVLQLTYIPRLCRLLAHNRAHKKRKVDVGARGGLGWPRVIWLGLDVRTVQPKNPHAANLQLNPWEHLTELDWVINTCFNIIQHGVKIIFYLDLMQLSDLGSCEEYSNVFHRLRNFIVGITTHCRNRDMTQGRRSTIDTTHIIWRFDFNFLRRQARYPTMLVILQNLETWFTIAIGHHLPPRASEAVAGDNPGLHYSQLMSLRQIDVCYKPLYNEWTWCFHRSGIAKPSVIH